MECCYDSNLISVTAPCGRNYTICTSCDKGINACTEGECEHPKVDDDDHTVLSSGWSITVGDLRKAIEGVPDDYEVMLENAEVDDTEISNVNINSLYPPSATGSPGLLILGGGQIVNAEYDYDNRMNAHFEIGGHQWWNSTRDDLPKGWVRRS